MLSIVAHANMLLFTRWHVGSVTAGVWVSDKARHWIGIGFCEQFDRYSRSSVYALIATITQRKLLLC